MHHFRLETGNGVLNKAVANNELLLDFRSLFQDFYIFCLIYIAPRKRESLSEKRLFYLFLSTIHQKRLYPARETARGRNPGEESES